MSGIVVHRGSGHRYVVSLGHNTSSPLDSQTLYWGDLEGVAMSAVAGISRCIFLSPGVITAVAINAIVAGTLGSTEAVSYYLRLNNTTDYLISNSAQLSAVQQQTTATLSVPVAEGDFIEIKMVCPAWATNPTNVIQSAALLVE